MAIALLDTNILIDALKGVAQTATELAYYSDIAISNITYMEFVVGLRKQLHTNFIDVSQFDSAMAVVVKLPVVQIDAKITEEAIHIRSNSLLGNGPQVKLPDAIILATANIEGRYLVTRDAKAFYGPNVRIPYQIDSTGTVIHINPSLPR